MPIRVGDFNDLKVKELLPNAVKFVSDDNEELTIKKKALKEEVKLGDELNLFVYTDNDGNTLATTSQPSALVGEFAYMRVVQESKIGAFMDWGIEKELLIPFSRQKERMREGFIYLVYVTIDEDSGRIVGTSKIDELLSNESVKLKEGDQVNLLICDKSDLGINVIVNNKHWGLLYKNEIFKKIKKGDRSKGFIKKIREDGKLDVSLQEQGYDEVFSASLKILGKLKEEGGFLPLNDKTEAGVIYNLLQMSKKTFKKAIGALYKERKIEIANDGIRLK